MSRRKSGASWAGMVLSIVALLWLSGLRPGPQVAADPSVPGPCATQSKTVQVGGDLETDFYYPAAKQCSGQITAPFPGIIFAHGFSMFGLSNGAADNADHGEHLASWGYVAAIPRLADDVEERLSSTEELLSYLAEETERSGSALHGMVDTDRLALAGHSFGGATALAEAAQSPRVKAVVALDPVYHQGGPGSNPEIWDHDVEGPKITAPTAILGAPSSSCNSEADYAEIYPYVGSAHKAQFFVASASHCDFSDPGNSLCYFVCGGSSNESEARMQLVQKYMTAWFNYYLHYEVDSYHYLYGQEADSDVAAGLIERELDTAPQKVRASIQEESVLLEWLPYHHPTVTGYNVYRRRAGEDYPELPQIRAGVIGAYLDGGLVRGETYSYFLRSHDGGGHEHQRSIEVSVTMPGEPSPEPELDVRLYVPLVVRE